MRKVLMLSIVAVAALACNDSTAPGYIKPAVIYAPALDTIAVGTTGRVTYFVVSATFDTLDRATVVGKATDTTVVKVSGDSITGLKIGSTTVSYFVLDTLGNAVPGVEADMVVNVVPQTIASLSLSISTDTLAVDSSVTITATALQSNDSASSGHTITWLSGNKQVATVVKGKVTAVAPGIARITAYTDSGISAAATIWVTATASGSFHVKRSDDGPSGEGP
ncbi:MAG TPA: Ig-like domain-containing protein [Gemmatimonadaceae bacterium]|nr:Ig-like domain-containing protein [Gemmatimonadaceae bacterium]